MDYNLWDAVKYKCNADKPETIHTLKDSICEAIGEMHIIDNLLQNWTDRVGYGMIYRGSHFNTFFYEGPCINI